MEINTFENLKLHKLISALVIVMGCMLMIYMIVVEDEPGAIPLLLIVAGTGWYFITRNRIRSQHT